MTMQTHNTDIAILNMESGDDVLHGNVLMVYEDQQDSPSCTAAFVGHLLRFAGQEALPFASGTLITTVPFRIETSRLGKPVEQVTHDDLASLKAKYQLRPDTPFTMILRKDVTAPPQQLFAHDIHHYAQVYYEQRTADIEKTFFAAEVEARQLNVPPDSSVCLLFGIEGLPVPVESAVFALPMAENEHSSAKAYALLWHLIRRREYVDSLMKSTHDAVANQAGILLRLHSQGDGTWCIGVQQRNSLMLLGQESEFAHFHRVASSEVAAREIGETLTELISRRFEIDVSTEVKQRGQHTC